MQSDKINCTVRQEKHSNGNTYPALYYWDEFGDLVSFTYYEGHNQTSYFFYISNTKPEKDTAKAAAMVAAYNKIGGENSGPLFVLKQRLTRH